MTTISNIDNSIKHSLQPFTFINKINDNTCYAAKPIKDIHQIYELIKEYVQTFPNLFPKWISYETAINIVLCLFIKVDKPFTKYTKINNNLVGRYQVFYTDGKPMIDCTYNIKGQRHGCYKTWDKNQLQTTHIHYNNGQLHGQYYRLHNNSECIMTEYQYGKIHGEYRLYQQDRTIISHYKNGILHGQYLEIQDEWYLPFISAICRKYIMYQDGKRHGKCIILYTDITHQNGRKLPFTSLITNIAYYYDDKPHGPYFSRNKFNGKIDCQVNYYQGSLHGICKIWNYKHRHYITCRFEYGKLLSEFCYKYQNQVYLKNFINTNLTLWEIMNYNWDV